MEKWRGANSLIVLKNQLDAAYPGWLYLGMLGDAAHRKVPSDHNPNAEGVVTAMDIGPGGGLDIHALANNLVAVPHPDLKYVISDRRIAEWQTGFKWKPYNGSDPHDTHIHVSVGRGDDGQSKQPYDDIVKWNITKGDYLMDSEDAKSVVYRGPLNREPENDQVWRPWVGKKPSDAIWWVRNTAEYKAKQQIIEVAYPKLIKQVSDLQEQLSSITTDKRTDQILQDMQSTIDKYKKSPKG